MMKKLNISVLLILLATAIAIGFTLYNIGINHATEEKSINLNASLKQAKEEIKRLDSEITELEKMIDEQRTEAEIFTPVPIDPSRLEHYNIVSSTEFQLDKDEPLELIELYVQAEKNEDGTFSFDDGQRWLLLVKDGNKEYVLYDNHIQLGALEAYVFKEYIDDEIIIHVVTLRGQTADLELSDYVKDLNSEIFIKTIEYKKRGIDLIDTLGL